MSTPSIVKLSTQNCVRVSEHAGHSSLAGGAAAAAFVATAAGGIVAAVAEPTSTTANAATLRAVREAATVTPGYARCSATAGQPRRHHPGAVEKVNVAKELSWTDL
jgi:hypothetical protein